MKSTKRNDCAEYLFSVLIMLYIYKIVGIGFSYEHKTEL